MGPNTCVPLGHMVKKQGAVSHSSTEAEIIALDATLRVDGIPALSLWQQILHMLSPEQNGPQSGSRQERNHNKPKGDVISQFIQSLDYVPTNMPEYKGQADLIVLEDNEPVIKMTVKQRWPQLRYVPRTHKIDLDWLFERFAKDSGIKIRYVNTRPNRGHFHQRNVYSNAISSVV